MYKALLKKSTLLNGLAPVWMWASLMLCSVTASADGENPDAVHWAFSAFFGTGWYEISGSESVFIMRAPLEKTFRESAYANGQRQLGIEFHYPVALGLHSLDGFNDFVDTDNFGTMTFTPGIELEIPVNEKWYLRPLIHIGWGKETDDGDSAWMYYGGIKSRYTPGSGKLDWSVLNALYHAGYDSREGGSGSISTAMMGAEFRHPLSAGENLQLNWHLTYSWMFDAAQFGLRSGISQTVDDQWELGFALSPRGRSFSFWFLTFEQLGLSLRASSGGEYRAIAINISSPFH